MLFGSSLETTTTHGHSKMSFKMKQLAPSERVLLGPGPSDVSTRVLQALGSPTIGHLDPEYLQVMDETRQLLKQVITTEN